MVRFKSGFISIPFLILVSLCFSLSSMLVYKIKMECEIMENMIFVNQHERKILESLYCIIQCDVSDIMMIEVDGLMVLLQFNGEYCHVSDALCTMIVQVDREEKVLKNVRVEK